MKTSTLWVVRGREPVLWTIPVFVEWHDKTAIIRPAVVLNGMQGHALLATVNKWGKIEDGNYIIRESALRQCAEEIPPEENAEMHFSWERVRAPQRTRYNAPEDQERREFLDELHLSGAWRPFCSRREEVDYVFHALCRFMLDWLVNQEKPVDLHFAKLHNWPWRQNFADAIYRREKAYDLRPRELMRKYGPQEACEIEVNARLRHAMLTGPFFRMIDGDVMGRALFIEPTRAWHSLIKRIERTRFEVLKEQAYADQFILSASRQWPRVARFLASWLASSLQSSPILLESASSGYHRFVSRALLRSGDKALIKRLFVTMRLAGFKSPDSRRSKKTVVRAKARAMPPVPHVQPGTPDLRNGA